MKCRSTDYIRLLSLLRTEEEFKNKSLLSAEEGQEGPCRRSFAARSVSAG